MRSFLIVFFLLFVPLASFDVRGAEQNDGLDRVTVFNFEISQDGEYSYLNKAISQMLTTRLSQNSKLRVITPQLDQQAYQSLKSALQTGDVAKAAADMQADWLVTGTMYSLQDGLQLNLDLYFKTDLKPVTFSMKAASEDEVIASVTALAKELSAHIDQPSPSEAEPAAVEAAPDELAGFTTPHPERAYKKGLYGSGAVVTSGDEEARFESRGVRRSSEIPIVVESLVAGDLNGDGVDEIVVASKSKIRVFSYADLQFKTVAEYDFSPSMKIHKLNLGDPGNTGTTKLFVSGNEGQWASSAILSWNGSKNLQSVRQGLRWYIRPLTIPGKGEILLGQETSYRTEENFLSPGVFELSIDPANGQLIRGNKLMLPENTNLFDFVYADLDGDRENELVLIDAKQKLLVYDAALDLIWVSSASYGGSKTYFGPNWNVTNQGANAANTLTESQQDNRTLVFIPGRLDTKDITGDGLPEVVVSTNEVGISKYLTNTRWYDGGSVACLGWYGQGLAELWRTSQISGYVADYYFDDSAKTDEQESTRVLNRLYVAQIPEVNIWERLLPTGVKSKILAYEMMVQRGADTPNQQ
ncbi:MAG: VCBS repeat-containing protein [Desulfocapsaceae bacterium]